MELAQKQLELLTQALPGKTKAGARYDAVSIDQFTAAEQAAESIGLKLHGLELENPPFDFDAAFRVLAQDSPDMLLVLSSAHSGGFNVLRRVLHRAGRGSCSKAVRTLAIPPTLQQSLTARLDRLDRAREVAQMGAALRSRATSWRRPPAHFSPPL